MPLRRPFIVPTRCQPSAGDRARKSGRWRRALRLFLAIAGFWLGFSTAALHGAEATNAPRYSVRIWQTEDGLPNNTVRAILQSRDGYLWVGTLDGLARFDGIRFEVLRQDNTPGLTDNAISCLFEDSQRNLWIGTENGGTVVLKDGRITAPPELAAGGSGRQLRSACEDDNGAVWLLHENGDLWRYARGKFTPFAAPPGATEARSIIHETNGPVRVATLHEQYAIGAVADTGSLELPLAGESQHFIRLEALAASRHGGYWRMGYGNVQPTVQRVTNDVAYDVARYTWSWEVLTACEDRDGTLVVGTAGAGAFFVTPDGTVSALSTNEGLSHSFVLSLCVDREGTLWVGTLEGGLNRVKRQHFDVVAPTSGWRVRSVTEGADGSLWIAANHGLGRWASGTFEQGIGKSYLSVFADRQRQVWISTEDAKLFRYRNGAFEGFPAGSLIQHPVQAIFQDRAGRMWFGTAGALVRLAEDQWTAFTTRDGLSANDITSLAEDAEGNLWIGTRRGGINRLRDGRFSALHRNDGVPSENIAGLLVDRDGVLWVSTPEGLGRFAQGKWSRYTTHEGLATDKLSYLVEDETGNLWLGSDAGILRVPKQSLNEVATGAASWIPCRTYEKGDGLLTRECSSGAQPGAWRAHDAVLWFATSKGVASVNPAHLQLNSLPPPVVIEAVSVNDAPMAAAALRGLPSGTLTLRPGDERLEIRYSSLNLSAPERARFRYQMSGLEKDWTDAGHERVAHYNSKLPPGHYLFRVIAANEDGVWNETGASLAVIVQPPFWSTWWFITGTTACLIGIIVAVVHYLSTQKLQRQLAVLRQQEALEKERARIARDIHDQVGASLTQVALLGELVETDKDSPADVQSHAQQISQTARETTRALDEIVWTVNPQNDTLEGLVNYICKYAQDYLAVAGLRYRFELPAELPAREIAPDVRHNVFLASKEAVTNIVRHAKATSAWLRLALEPDSFTIEIEDNGRGVAGLDLNAPRVRNGLKNMRKRMEDVGGTFSIGPGSEGGALVRLKVPLHTRNAKPETRNQLDAHHRFHR